jgi:hypothetical protein
MSALGHKRTFAVQVPAWRQYAANTRARAVSMTVASWVSLRPSMGRMMASNGLFKDQCQSMRNRDASKDEDYSRHCHCCTDHSVMRSRAG